MCLIDDCRMPCAFNLEQTHSYLKNLNRSELLKTIFEQNEFLFFASKLLYIKLIH
jgi:hypothetical protein